jgi:hypothetical protein
MAHKVKTQHYRRLRDLLEATGKSYAIYLSTALHEGTSFDDDFTAAFEDLRALFDGRVYFLGFLSDAALFNQMCDASFVAAFFEDGVRANNTSVNSAMECGAIVITNLDDRSPPEYAHMQNMIDIARCDALPVDEETRARIATAAATVASQFGWDNLLAQLCREMPEPLASRAAGAMPRR